MLVCPYHAWTYNLDGTFRNARFVDGMQDFDPAEFSLRPVQVEVFLGMVFFNLDATSRPFTEFVSGLEAEIEGGGCLNGT